MGFINFFVPHYHKIPRNLSVHSFSLANLFLSNSEKCLEILKHKLAEFDLENFICSTTDGASVMKKFGRLSEIEHQLCMFHGIHLSVTDVLYCKEKNLSMNEILNSSGLENQNDEIDADDEDDDGSLLLDDENYLEEMPLSGNIRVIIQKIRNLVKLFRNSPTKNDVLQNNVNLQFSREKVLLLDSKIR